MEGVEVKIDTEPSEVKKEEPTDTDLEQNEDKVYSIWEEVPIIFVCLTIILSYLTIIVVIIFLLPLFYSTPTIIFWTIVTHVIIYLISYNYYSVHVVQSDIIPESYYRVDEENIDESRMCQICKKYKADRVHHDRTTKKCIYRYDHYCGVVQNALGYHNYRYFFLFLFYVEVGLLCLDFNVAIGLYRLDILKYVPKILLIAFILFFANFSISIGGQVFFQAVMISLNLTTKEFVDWASQVLRERRFVPLPYYKTVLLNWKECMQVPEDKNVLLGFLPTKPRMIEKRSL
ncbi:zinc finger protein DHHC domain containing protein, putative [Entamoeba invadens IP1]|uniref:Palmitoyltransferase n=1 Tax=Entamoeba invadens IP1 TaxID=370355 RepID=A0A0A1UEM2_ENTIV|nr:zinc finger protein DHHC domain containing protein, putative [Entamoeba invadens IP1]ELP91281.1 zinc finger protein DHHC domain containing protein, putative [Entamoeba invadens IP1]|eukprot:XP_004258052.1 zinc finger protein DHHC domain containing protein, putative [Entamoeba invadens IP1]